VSKIEYNQTVQAMQQNKATEQKKCSTTKQNRASEQLTQISEISITKSGTQAVTNTLVLRHDGTSALEAK